MISLGGIPSNQQACRHPDPIPHLPPAPPPHPKKKSAFAQLGGQISGPPFCACAIFIAGPTQKPWGHRKFGDPIRLTGVRAPRLLQQVPAQLRTSQPGHQALHPLLRQRELMFPVGASPVVQALSRRQAMPKSPCPMGGGGGGTQTHQVIFGGGGTKQNGKQLKRCKGDSLWQVSVLGRPGTMLLDPGLEGDSGGSRLEATMKITLRPEPNVQTHDCRPRVPFVCFIYVYVCSKPPPKKKRLPKKGRKTSPSSPGRRPGSWRSCPRPKRRSSCCPSASS